MGKRRKTKKDRRESPPPPIESKAAEAATIFWMLASLATLLAEVASLALKALAFWVPAAAWLNLPAGLFLLIGLVTGVISLALILPVRQLRRVPPPAGIVALVLAIGSLPLVTLGLLWLATPR